MRELQEATQLYHLRQDRQQEVVESINADMLQILRELEQEEQIDLKKFSARGKRVLKGELEEHELVTGQQMYEE